MIDRDALRRANAALRADIADPARRPEGLPRVAKPPARPVPGRTLRPGQRLPMTLARVLAGLIARHPGEPDGRIVERFAAATGVRITRPAVRFRRPRRAGVNPTRPLSAAEEATLAGLLRDHPGATAPRIAALFEGATGRRIMRQTVLRRDPARKVVRPFSGRSGLAP